MQYWSTEAINGIFYVPRAGIPWADLPVQYGPSTTVYNRFYAGHGDQIKAAIADAHNIDMVMVDGTSIRTALRDHAQKTPRVVASGAHAAD